MSGDTQRTFGTISFCGRIPAPRVEQGEYNVKPHPLTNCTATINEKLLKAEALAWVVNDPLAPDKPIAETLALIAQLIREAREAHNEQWEQLTEAKGEG